MTYYEVRSDDGVVGHRCYTKSAAIVEAGRMTTAYGLRKVRVFKVQTSETEVFSMRGDGRCA